MWVHEEPSIDQEESLIFETLKHSRRYTAEKSALDPGKASLTHDDGAISSLLDEPEQGLGNLSL